MIENDPEVVTGVCGADDSLLDERMAAMDADHDGDISREEFFAYHWALSAGMPADGTGAFTAMIKAMWNC